MVCVEAAEAIDAAVIELPAPWKATTVVSQGAVDQRRFCEPVGA
jgi:hypothetical protein